MSDPNIEVVLTDPQELHCFKLVFHAALKPGSNERQPIEIFLHATQAVDLFTKLAGSLSNWMHANSAYLLEMRAKGEQCHP